MMPEVGQIWTRNIIFYDKLINVVLIQDVLIHEISGDWIYYSYESGSSWNCDRILNFMNYFKYDENLSVIHEIIV